MGGGARALVRQPKTAVFLRKSPKPGGSKSVNIVNNEKNLMDFNYTLLKI